MKIYLASPYSHENHSVMHTRYELAAAAGSCLLVASKQLGIPIKLFVPIVHSHPIAVYGHLEQCDHDLWLDQDREFMDWADVLVILDLNGWNESIGVQYEYGYMAGQKKPIVHMKEVSDQAAGSAIRMAELKLKMLRRKA